MVARERLPTSERGAGGKDDGGNGNPPVAGPTGDVTHVGRGWLSFVIFGLQLL